MRSPSDDQDFSAFVQSRWARLVRTATLLGCGLHESEDIVQATLVKCYVAWPRVSRARDRDAYVYGMLVNTLRSVRRRRSSTELVSAELPQPLLRAPDDIEHAEVAATVHQALEKLSVPERQVVVLRYFTDLSERQTAEALAVPTGTVKSRLSRALARLAGDANLVDLSGRSSR